MFYDRYKQRPENPKAWKEKKQDIINQQKQGFQLTPFWNMEKGFQKKDYHSNTQSAQWGGGPINMGDKKVGDNLKEPLKCLECG